MLRTAAFTGAAGATALALNARTHTHTQTQTPVAFAAGGAVSGSGPFGNPAHGWDYYQKCVVGGALACGLTHAAVTPLDVTKCRMQVMPETYKNLRQGLPLVMAERSAYLGWAPTLFGYSAQGMAKYGFYEMFKDLYSSTIGWENAEKYRGIVWASASASAEFFADMALSPFEATKVAMQTSKPEANFPRSIGPAMSKLSAEKGTAGFFRILPALWGRQIPYTIAKFVAFEGIVNMFYANVFTAPKETYSKGTQLGITFTSGYLAGVLCAVVSHPADTMVSKLNQTPGASVGSIYANIGFGGLWKGLGARILMVGTLTGLQWWIYDTFKVAVGLQASGGSGKK